MNKKLILTSIVAISFAMPAMAEITSGATCDTTNLGQSENNSTANVEAIWNANTYMIRYRCGNTASFISASSCSLTNIARGKCANVTYDESFSFLDNCNIISQSPGEGYTFTGWSCTDSSDNTTTYTPGQTITWNIDSGLDCTAQWNANTINIDWYNGGTRIAQNTCTYGGTIITPQQPSKTGYTFNGWILFDICPTFDTAQACRANSGCLWNNNDNVCIGLNACSDLNETECASNPSCVATYRGGGGAISFGGCQIDSEILCPAQSDAESCENFADCAWDYGQNECIVAGEIEDTPMA